MLEVKGTIIYMFASCVLFRINLFWKLSIIVSHILILNCMIIKSAWKCLHEWRELE